MKKPMSGHAYVHGGLPLLYKWDNDLSEEQKALMDKFLLEPPTLGSLRSKDDNELPTDMLIALGYLLTDVEPTPEEEDSAKAIVVAFPKARAEEIANDFTLLVDDETHFKSGVEWDFIFNYCNATHTTGENVKFIRCIREVEAQLEKGECILAAAIGVGNNCDADDIVFTDAPFPMEGVFLTTNRVLFFYEHDEFDMRDAGFCYIDSYDYDELRSLRFRLRRIPLYTNDPFADDDEDETHDYLAESVEVNVKEHGATRQSHFSIAMFKPKLLLEQNDDDQYEGMADKFLTWSDAVMDSFHDCDQYVDIVD